jgi:3-phenylpropionate/trans-cinnamate dioxygenase ferredoxin reductase subunit
VGEVDVLVIGAGLAGAGCVEELRSAGFDGSVLLVGREPDPPYDRSAVSKSYLAAKQGRDETLLHPDDWYGEQNIDLRTRTSVTKLDPAEKVATLSTKEEVRYERALLAPGAHVRRLPVEGTDLEGVHYLRALRNADVLRADIEGVDRVVIVGGSYIGTEVAASLTVLGKQVALVMQEDVTHERSFGAQAGGFFQRVLTEHGVEVHGGEQVARFEGAGERIERVVCGSGLELEAGAVVLGVGAVPDTMLAKAAGLELGDRGGVICDSALRTSSDGLWVAGDIAEYDSVLHGRRMRIEHWEVAMEQGKFAGRAMATGSDAPYDVVPYFFSDLADWTGLEYVGPAQSWDEEDVRGSIDDGEFSVFYREGGRVVAALAVGRSDDIEEARRLMREERPPR